MAVEGAPVPGGFVHPLWLTDAYKLESVKRHTWMYFKYWMPDWQYGGVEIYPSGHLRYCVKKIP